MTEHEDKLIQALNLGATFRSIANEEWTCEERGLARHTLELEI